MFSYLIAEDNTYLFSRGEIKSSRHKISIYRQKELLNNTHIILDILIRIAFVKSLVWSAPFYGTEI